MDFEEEAILLKTGNVLKQIIIEFCLIDLGFSLRALSHLLKLDDCNDYLGEILVQSDNLPIKLVKKIWARFSKTKDIDLLEYVYARTKIALIKRKLEPMLYEDD